MSAEFGKFWQIWAVLGRFQLNLAIFSRFRLILAIFGRFRQISADFGRFWQILADIGRFCLISADFGRFWQSLRDFGWFWQNSADFGWLGQILADFRFFGWFWQILELRTSSAKSQSVPWEPPQPLLRFPVHILYEYTFSIPCPSSKPTKMLTSWGFIWRCCKVYKAKSLKLLQETWIQKG